MLSARQLQVPDGERRGLFERRLEIARLGHRRQRVTVALEDEPRLRNFVYMVARRRRTESFELRIRECLDDVRTEHLRQEIRMVRAQPVGQIVDPVERGDGLDRGIGGLETGL